VKLSLGRASLVALVLAIAAGAATASCADSDVQPFTPPPDGGDATVPEANVDGGVDADASAPDASARTCSIHGFCRTILPAAQTLRGVWGDGSGVVWAVSTQGNVLRWDGNAWKVHASDLGSLSAIWGSGPTDVWVGGERGIFHGTGASSAGLEFRPSSLPGAAPTRVSSIWGASATDLWAVGRMEDLDTGEPLGRVLHYAGGGDAGATWALDDASNAGLKYTHVWGSAGSGVWIAGTRPIPDELYEETVVLRKNGAGAFVAETLPEDGQPFPFGVLSSVHGVAAVSDSLVWIYGRATVGRPGIWKGTSTDSGKTFAFTYIADGKAVDPLWSALSATGPNDAWVVGEYGRVRHWDGSDWATAAITTTNVPIIDPFYGVWSDGSSQVWLVGDAIALRYDPTQVQEGAP